ncbi:UDP-glucose dehydrogenase family protein [Candidatus Rariloculus sp.]|uniref:UDP-glucose dehydrogenase family protein n=1 Tax=Candidatus Rariloculus sp. TaxID=3101265 RepID=UPI003D09DAD7
MHYVTIFGAGHVGLVTGACLADAGNDVLCIDVDKEKIERLNHGEIPIYEPGLGTIVRKATRSGRLRFTADIGAGVAHGLFLFIAVGTPPDEDGSADLTHVLSVARSIGEHIEEYRVVVDKSTVPVGTADRVRAEIGTALDRRGVSCEFDVVSNPEFLKEGAAVEDFMKPARIVVGTDHPRTAELLRGLYQPFNRNHDRMLIMDTRSAELTKYAANAMLATKISFMNEMANLAELVGADIEQIRVGIGSDPRIGHAYIYPGAGYGGSCFPKDVRALTASASAHGYRLELLSAVEHVNNRQKHLLFEKISHYFAGELRGKTIALWGLAFKPNTDDMREASSRVLMEALWDAGAEVRAYDPVAMDEARRLYPGRGDLHLCERAEQAIEGADALAIVTEWREFNSPDFDVIKATLANPVIFDGRNLYDSGELERRGIRYFGIGRGESVELTARKKSVS